MVGLGIEKNAKDRRVIKSLKGLRGKGRRKKEGVERKRGERREGGGCNHPNELLIEGEEGH